MGRLTRFVQDWDTRWQRWREPDVRRVLVYVRAPMNFVVMAPVYRRMSTDPRVKFYFTTSPGASREADVYSEAEDGLSVINASEAKFMKFDACLAADFIWLSLPRGTKAQMSSGSRYSSAPSARYGSYPSPTTDTTGRSGPADQVADARPNQ